MRSLRFRSAGSSSSRLFLAGRNALRTCTPVDHPSLQCTAGQVEKPRPFGRNHVASLRSNRHIALRANGLESQQPCHGHGCNTTANGVRLTIHCAVERSPGADVPQTLFLQFVVCNSTSATEWPEKPIKLSWSSSSPSSAGYLFYGHQQDAAPPAPADAVRIWTEDTGLVKVLGISTKIEHSGGVISQWFAMNSWLTKSQKKRIAFEGTAAWAPGTPQPLKTLRLHELQVIRGVRKGMLADPETPRGGSERFYDYDTYNDLGTAKKHRPVLGGARYPYPRRLKTNRNKGVGEFEQNVTIPWVPLDEQFSYTKRIDFEGTNLQTYAPALLELLEQAQRILRPRNPILGILSVLDQTFCGGKLRTPRVTFKRFSHISELYQMDVVQLPSPLSSTIFLKPADVSEDDIKGAMRRTREIRRVNRVNRREGKDVEAIPDPTKRDLLMKVLGEGISYLRSHEVPKVLDGRAKTCFSDAEFARQMVAGQNPCVVQLLKTWPQDDWTISDSDLAGLLPDGTNMDQLVAEHRAYYVEYWEPFYSYQARVNTQKGRFLYCGRALFIVTSPQTKEDQAGHAGQEVRPPHQWAAIKEEESEDIHEPNAPPLSDAGTLGSEPTDGSPAEAAADAARRMQRLSLQVLKPVAIELYDGKEATVYTPPVPGEEGAEDGMQLKLWLLARAAFLSLDSGFHQLISHWQRTHCCLEPYHIATMRQLSSAHPVYKILVPHFKYTLIINARARGVLINAGGNIEQLWTPGVYAMQISSEWYADQWTFSGQALPHDLKARGMMNEKGEIVLHDYPYAEDGMAIWQALEDYFQEYLALYYHDDAAVKHDHELQEWWTEIQEKGHPEIRKGWPPLCTRADLIFILTTMAWTASAHHAAVNFGQYDFSGFPLTHSSIFKKAIPTNEMSREYRRLERAQGAEFERAMLEYIMDPIETAKMLVLMKTLSVHSDDEQYLSSPEQPYLTDPRAKAVHARFVKRMQELEDQFMRLNRSLTKPSREPEVGGMHYTVLLPSSKPGLTGRGIPYSTSI